MGDTLRVTLHLDESGRTLTMTLQKGATPEGWKTVRESKGDIPAGGGPAVAQLLEHLATGRLDPIAAAQVLINAGVLAAPDVIRTAAALPEITVNKGCPKCGKRLIIKTNRNEGSQFLACPGYPNCKHTESIPESIRMHAAGASSMFDLLDGDGTP